MSIDENDILPLTSDQAFKIIKIAQKVDLITSLAKSFRKDIGYRLWVCDPH